MNANLSNEQIDGLKAGIQDMMQGLMTLNKVLTKVQMPESADYSDAGTELHDAHIETFKRYHGIYDAHVQAYERSQQLYRKCSKRHSGFLKGSGFRGDDHMTNKEPF